MMLNSCGQLEEIQSLITSNSKSSKSFGYTSLLSFQEQCNSDSSSILALSECSRSLTTSIVTDFSDDGEDVVAPALKCLGFMIYHPSIVATILADEASVVLQSLARLITTTKMKSVCNLGIWCISIQQMDVSFLAADFQSLLRAVIHALDNPFGSLSTTFEAMQAVMKLTAQLGEKMREYSHIWVPLICRRLLSTDQKERDISDRCMSKIKSAILPPTVALSKALVEDMKQKLLSRMKNLISQGMKVQCVQAWRWYIRLLGIHAMKKKRHLINDMLHVLETTFPDHNPQVQIASLVAWEGLIDSLIHNPIQVSETKSAINNGILEVSKPIGNVGNIQDNGFLKSIKLIMTPLVGIISSNCDVSVRSSCFNTWYYLLYKLDTSINCSSVMKLVFDPILEKVLQIGPDGKNICLWNQCLELLNDFILAKCKMMECEINGPATRYLLAKTSVLIPPMSGTYSCMQYPLKWLPWDLSRLDFFINTICIIIGRGAKEELCCEDRKLACNAALRIFRSALKGVQMELKNISVEYKDIMLCLNSLLRFIKKISEDLYSGGSGGDDMYHASLQIVKVSAEELEPSILGSPLYKVALDLSYADKLLSNEIRHAKVVGIGSITQKDMVSPIVYLIVVYIGVLNKSTTLRMELVLDHFHKFNKCLLSSYDPSEILYVMIGLLYKLIGYGHLLMWTAVTKSLNYWIEEFKDLSPFKTESDSTGYRVICYLVAYPFLVCFSVLQNSASNNIRSSLEESLVSSQQLLESGHVIETWNTIYDSVGSLKLDSTTRNFFLEELCTVLNGCLEESSSLNEANSSCKDPDLNLLSLWVEVATCMLEHIIASEVNSGSIKDKQGGHFTISSGMRSMLEFAARFVKFSSARIRADSLTGLLCSRVFSAMARFVSGFDMQQDIFQFIEILSCPLLEWLSHVEMNNHVHLLWAEILSVLQRVQPRPIFNSSLLNLLARLLEKTLDHPNASISETTIKFWNSTYGKQIMWSYPQNLLPVLDKLSRDGRININTRSQPLLKRCRSILDDDNVPQTFKYKVAALNNHTSKRVKLIEEESNGFEIKDNLSSSSRRKKLELTEHQKEVRRAQQGRERDCSGHGPGIRTYTTVDFSQGNEDSQDSQDIRNSESILEMLKTVP